MIRVNLNVIMARKRVSLTELSERVGLTMANLSILKNEKARAIRLSTLDALCRELECQPGELLEWVEDEG
ncbi:helix-turn-helix domain-containing protein [Candidatus Neomarinimicrobiota bacterium]